ncbi:tol-pal system protein YbgF [Vibrio sp. JC009]|uniref:tol-pal system protein YbgF n=1 Tax=Vibrio sp. JC009 TaxID=2912314 RepID=UPI0023B03F90|nr:tol-pal system protein YbgF [Vibrio sp. JC009]WED22777.1 tol-pal system protein YbgF [Vibrio sp. JC009]
MFSNLKRAVSLVLLASAAGVVLAAPAPVSNVNESASSTASVTSSSETDVQRLERMLKNRNRVQIQMQQQIDDMVAEIAELRGEVERNSYEMKKMLDRQRELFVELDKVRSEAKTATPAAPVSGSEGQQAQDKPTDGQFSSNEKEQEDYQSAVDLILQKRDYQGALDAFKQFQVDYPNSVYAANAHYWLGQLYFARKEDVEAAKSFASVVSFSESSKRADALVKLGDIATRNSKPDVAKEYYQQVVNEYPDSSSAKTAKSRMK